jgi:hypothetical protein
MPNLRVGGVAFVAVENIVVRLGKARAERTCAKLSEIQFKSARGLRFSKGKTSRDRTSDEP